MDIRKKQRAVVDALEDIKGRDIVVFNTERLSAYFERVIIATGDSTRQVRALAENVEEELRKLGAKVRGIEGSDNAEWVLVDLGDIVVHVMHPTARLLYNLEEIWGGKDVKMKRDPEPIARAAPKPKGKPKVPVPVPAKAKPKPKAKPKAKTKTKTKAKSKGRVTAPVQRRKAPARKKSTTRRP